MVTFTSDDWQYVKKVIEKHLENKRAALENKDSNYRQLVESRAQVLILKTILELPEQHKLSPAKG